MFVYAYQAEFTAMSRFAPHMVSDEEIRVQRFQRGLKISIRNKLVQLGLDGFDKSLSNAQLIKRDLEDRGKKGRITKIVRD